MTSNYVLTDTIDSCHHCKGIDDQKFFPIAQKNKGEFYDFQGMYVNQIADCVHI